jgi:hypothetical protein
MIKMIKKLIALSIVLLLIALVACTQEEYKTATYQQFTIDDRKGIPQDVIEVDEIPEPDLTPEEKAVQWQKAREEEDKFQQLNDMRENEQRDKEEEERIQEEIDFFNSS